MENAKTASPPEGRRATSRVSVRASGPLSPSPSPPPGASRPSSSNSQRLSVKGGGSQPPSPKNGEGRKSIKASIVQQEERRPSTAEKRVSITGPAEAAEVKEKETTDSKEKDDLFLDFEHGSKGGKYSWKHELWGQALQKKSEDRTELDIQAIHQWISSKQIEFLKQIDRSLLLQLCHEFKVLEYSPHDVVFRQGDQGLSFYVIALGTVGIFIKQDDHEDFHRGQARKQLHDFIAERKKGGAGAHAPISGAPSHGVLINTLKAGTGFGELALMQHVQRTATAVALEYSVLLSIDKKNYDRAIKTVHLSKTKHILDFLSNHFVFSRWAQQKRVSFSYALQKRNWGRKKAIFKQGEEPQSVFLIESGECVYSYSVRDSRGKKKQIDLASIGPGHIAGEYEILKRLPTRTCSLIANGDVIGYEVSREQFRSHLRDRLAHQLEKAATERHNAHVQRLDQMVKLRRQLSAGTSRGPFNVAPGSDVKARGGSLAEILETVRQLEEGGHETAKEHDTKSHKSLSLEEVNGDDDLVVGDESKGEDNNENCFEPPKSPRTNHGLGTPAVAPLKLEQVHQGAVGASSPKAASSAKMALPLPSVSQSARPQSVRGELDTGVHTEMKTGRLHIGNTVISPRKSLLEDEERLLELIEPIKMVSRNSRIAALATPKIFQRARGKRQQRLMRSHKASESANCSEVTKWVEHEKKYEALFDNQTSDLVKNVARTLQVQDLESTTKYAASPLQDFRIEKERTPIVLPGLKPHRLTGLRSDI